MNIITWMTAMPCTNRHRNACLPLSINISCFVWYCIFFKDVYTTARLYCIQGVNCVTHVLFLWLYCNCTQIYTIINFTVKLDGNSTYLKQQRKKWDTDSSVVSTITLYFSSPSTSHTISFWLPKDMQRRIKICMWVNNFTRDVYKNKPHLTLFHQKNKFCIKIIASIIVAVRFTWTYIL